MTFPEYPYTRPDYEAYRQEFSDKLIRFEQASGAAGQKEVFDQLLDQIRHLTTLRTLCEIRFSINTLDPFYQNENEYWDEYGPLYDELTNRMYRTLLQSPHLEELKKEIPAVYFQLLECSLKSFDPIIITDLQEENRLSSNYAKLIASAQIPFEGSIYTLKQLQRFTLDQDRSRRKAAYDAMMSFYSEHQQEIDSIYDQLVQVRDGMAKKLGYDSYIQLGYYRMSRLDYDEAMVDTYRKQVLKSIVPLATSLYQRQQQRLGLDRLRYYDESYQFRSGNATPIGTYDDMIAAATTMYHQLSKETGVFFDFMVEHQLLDLVAKKGKQGGGYCTFIHDYEAPFIFSNFNGTSADVDVLTHEAGHAFQTFQSRWIKIPELSFPTMESCEIHSMSMEFFTYPWMELFFGKQADKYRYAHLADAITFLPYGVLVDHFQHEVYRHPHMTPAERNATWRKLERQYLPHKDYEGCPLLEQGGWWYKQQHIFNSPFYYIDYTLAQVCALQFFARTQQNDPTAWNDYLHLCSLGGTMSFTQLVKEAGLRVPFEEGCLDEVAAICGEWLRSKDDTRF